MDIFGIPLSAQSSQRSLFTWCNTAAVSATVVAFFFGFSSPALVTHFNADYRSLTKLIITWATETATLSAISTERNSRSVCNECKNVRNKHKCLKTKRTQLIDPCPCTENKLSSKITITDNRKFMYRVLLKCFFSFLTFLSIKRTKQKWTKHHIKSTKKWITSKKYSILWTQTTFPMHPTKT